MYQAYIILVCIIINVLCPFISSFNYYTFYIIYKPKSIIINKLILPLGQIFKQYAVYHINLHSLNFIIMTKLSSNEDLLLM